MPPRQTEVVESRIWVEAWQLQCCGDPFEVGQPVSWTVTSAVDREYLENVIGAEAAAAVTDHEDHHDVAGGDVRPLSGTVTDIAAVSCHFALQGRALYPVPGTAVVETRSRADGREHEDGSLRFLGYIVTLTSRTPA
jgi:hypothetical protein